MLSPVPRADFHQISTNEVRDLTAKLLSEVCHDICQFATDYWWSILSGTSAITEDGTRLDITGNKGGGTFRMHLFDVQVFNPHAPLNRHHNFASKRAYKQKVQEVEHGSFTPLVLPLTGGPSNPAPICYKRLASMLFTKHEQLYSSAIAFLLHSSIQRTKGAHTSGGHAHVYKSKYLMSISILIPVFFLLIHTR